MGTKQPEALRLAYTLDLLAMDMKTPRMAAAELRRQHAENESLRTGYDAARLEIESLKERVQELGKAARDVNSRRVQELEAQLEAIGAGDVEPLRKRECLYQISEPAQDADHSKTANVAGLESAVAHMSCLLDAFRALLAEVDDVCGRDGFDRVLEEGESEIIDKIRAALAMTNAAPQPAAPAQAGEYPPLVCDYCGALTPDPWHSSGMLHGKRSKHIHSCDSCVVEAEVQKQDEALIRLMLAALEHHTEQTRPITRTDDAINAARLRLEGTQ